MLRLTSCFKLLSMDTLSTNLQTKRWRRKPRWLPTAKSKLYKVPVRPVIPQDEMEELKRLNNNYRTQMKSIRRYLAIKYTVGMSQKIDQEHNLRVFEEDFAQCNAVNDKWNAAIRIEREQFFKQQLEREIEVAQERLIEHEEKSKFKLEEAENLVREQKEQVKNFITPENIDSAIEHALANTVDYNFSIDLTGKVYYGRDTVPTIDEKDKISVKR